MASLNQDIHVRRATQADLETLVQFNAAMAKESEGRELDLETLRAGVAAVFHDSNRGFYLVAETSGQVVGQLLVTTEWSDWRNGFFWWIQSVYIRADFRRRGVYRALHAHVVGLAKAAEGVVGVRLYVENENQPAQKTNANLGMKPSGHFLFEQEFDNA